MKKIRLKKFSKNFTKVFCNIFFRSCSPAHPRYGRIEISPFHQKTPTQLTDKVDFSQKKSEKISLKKFSKHSSKVFCNVLFRSCRPAHPRYARIEIDALLSSTPTQEKFKNKKSENYDFQNRKK